MREPDELASQRRYAEAFALVERAGRVLAGDSTLEALREAVSVEMTVRTEPPGATVRALPITTSDPDTTAARETWGTAPIVDRTVPRVDHLVVATLDGHRPVERLLAPGQAYVKRPEVGYVSALGLPRIEAPTLMVHGRQDEEHPWLTRGRALWNLLNEPKQLALIEGEGHLPRPEALIPPIGTFLDETLGPVVLPDD